MVPEARSVGNFPSICPNSKYIQSMSSPECPTPNCSVGRGKCLVVAFLECLCCSDVLAPPIFRAWTVSLSRHSLLWQDLTRFGFPVYEKGQTELWSISQLHWLEAITRMVQMLVCQICCCPVFLTSPCCSVCVLEPNGKLCIIKQIVGDIPEHWLRDSSFKCHIHMRKKARLLSMHSKRQLSFNCFY